MGTYDLTVNKTGVAVFSRTQKLLSLTAPIKVVMTGQVNKELLGQKYYSIARLRWSLKRDWIFNLL
ncbi:MAG: hypothetical protein ACJASL_004481 [Paraglaciecola sp.]|jgi:hypothetical protein